MTCVGLAKLWESNATIRDRLRDERRLLTHPPEDNFCKATRPNCTSNADVLKPVLKRLGEDRKHRLPHLEAFKAEIETIHEKCGITSMGEKGIYKCTMELKQLAGFVKRRSTRKEVTKEWGWDGQMMLQGVVKLKTYIQIDYPIQMVILCHVSQIQIDSKWLKSKSRK